VFTSSNLDEMVESDGEGERGTPPPSAALVKSLSGQHPLWQNHSKPHPVEQYGRRVVVNLGTPQSKMAAADQLLGGIDTCGYV
jgi:hypothetical protein